MEVICGQGGYNMENITAIKHKIREGNKIPAEKKLEDEFANLVNQVNFLISETTELICKTIKDLTEYW